MMSLSAIQAHLFFDQNPPKTFHAPEETVQMSLPSIKPVTFLSKQAFSCTEWTFLHSHTPKYHGTGPPPIFINTYTLQRDLL